MHRATRWSCGLLLAAALAPPAPSSFGEDADGELYLTSYSGRIYRLAPKP